MSTVEILEHRGGWCEKFEALTYTVLQNSLNSFQNSLQRKNGIELDVRDLNDNLIIAHNTANSNDTPFEQFLQLYSQYENVGTLAINIKSSELQSKVKSLLLQYNVKNYFTFDMSIPDTLKYIRENIHFYLRESEYESNPQKNAPQLYEKAKGIWLDQFYPSIHNTSWITLRVIKQHLDAGKKIAIVSPELHYWGKDATNKLYIKVWEQYKLYFQELSYHKYNLSNIALCTDFPTQAARFFSNIKY